MTFTVAENLRMRSLRDDGLSIESITLLINLKRKSQSNKVKEIDVEKRLTWLRGGRA